MLSKYQKILFNASIQCLTFVEVRLSRAKQGKQDHDPAFPVSCDENTISRFNVLGGGRLHTRRPGRGPDFEVSFTTSLTFMVEVTRLRGILAGQLFNDRFIDMVCAKLGQLLAQRINLLLVGVEGPLPTQGEIQAIMLRLQQRAESNDSAIVQRYGFRDRADFFSRYQRLSAILVRGGTPLRAGEPIFLWDNPQAKSPLPAKVRTALIRSHML